MLRFPAGAAPAVLGGPARNFADVHVEDFILPLHRIFWTNRRLNFNLSLKFIHCPLLVLACAEGTDVVVPDECTIYGFRPHFDKNIAENRRPDLCCCAGWTVVKSKGMINVQ